MSVRNAPTVDPGRDGLARDLEPDARQVSLEVEG